MVTPEVALHTPCVMPGTCKTIQHAMACISPCTHLYAVGPLALLRKPQEPSNVNATHLHDTQQAAAEEMDDEWENKILVDGNFSAG
jgi:hypothetical protein